MAAFASFGLLYYMKAYPLHFPELVSLCKSTNSISPIGENKSFKSFSDISASYSVNPPI